MDASEIRWNDSARAKILEDADRVLREAVLEIAESRPDISSDDAFAELNARLKDRFIDYEPGPDIRTYAEAIAAGQVGGAKEGEPSPDGAPGDDETAAGAAKTTGDEQTTDDAPPPDEELDEPSTEKEPGEEPKGGSTDPEPSHEAVGIGVIGAPLVDPEQS